MVKGGTCFASTCGTICTWLSPGAQEGHPFCNSQRPTSLSSPLGSWLKMRRARVLGLKSPPGTGLQPIGDPSGRRWIGGFRR